jgi:hypothetical protein
MPVRLSCPSCNTAFTVPELPADRRAACPRCGDQFPIRTFTETASEDGAVLTSAAGPGAATAERKARAQWSLMRALMVALVMGLFGLIAGVIVYYSNVGFHRADVGEPPPPPNAVIRAADLIGLGYLPADDNIAFAIQPNPIVEYAQRVHQEPGQLLVQAGIPEKVMSTLTQLGLTLPQISHVVGGTSLGDGAVTLRLTVVLVLNRPLADEDQFRSELKAHKHDGKGRYDVEVAGLPMTLARVSPTIWVFGIDAKDLAGVDRGGYGPGGKQLPAGLSQSIADRIPQNAAVWIAAGDEPWADKPAVKLIVGQFLGKKDWLPVLAKGRSALAALSFEDPPRLRLFIQTANVATGQQLREYFRKQAAADEKATTGGAGEWVLFDAPIDPMNGQSTIKRFLDAAEKK